MAHPDLEPKLTNLTSPSEGSNVPAHGTLQNAAAQTHSIAAPVAVGNSGAVSSAGITGADSNQQFPVFVLGPQGLVPLGFQTQKQVQEMSSNSFSPNRQHATAPASCNKQASDETSQSKPASSTGGKLEYADGDSSIRTVTATEAYAPSPAQDGEAASSVSPTASGVASPQKVQQKSKCESDTEIASKTDAKEEISDASNSAPIATPASTSKAKFKVTPIRTDSPSEMPASSESTASKQPNSAAEASNATPGSAPLPSITSPASAAAIQQATILQTLGMLSPHGIVQVMQNFAAQQAQLAAMLASQQSSVAGTGVPVLPGVDEKTAAMLPAFAPFMGGLLGAASSSGMPGSIAAGGQPTFLPPQLHDVISVFAKAKGQKPTDTGTQGGASVPSKTNSGISAGITSGASTTKTVNSPLSAGGRSPQSARRGKTDHLLRRVVQRMTQKKWPQAQLARYINEHKSTLSKQLAGARGVNAIVARRLEAWLELSDKELDKISEEMRSIKSPNHEKTAGRDGSNFDISEPATPAGSTPRKSGSKPNLVAGLGACNDGIPLCERFSPTGRSQNLDASSPAKTLAPALLAAITQKGSDVDGEHAEPPSSVTNLEKETVTNPDCGTSMSTTQAELEENANALMALAGAGSKRSAASEVSNSTPSKVARQIDVKSAAK